MPRQNPIVALSSTISESLYAARRRSKKPWGTSVWERMKTSAYSAASFSRSENVSTVA
ncbi:MAG: hypothetical protein AAGD33_15415 [Actinomycetota bacterium]